MNKFVSNGKNVFTVLGVLVLALLRFWRRIDLNLILNRLTKKVFEYNNAIYEILFI